MSDERQSQIPERADAGPQTADGTGVGPAPAVFRPMAAPVVPPPAEGTAFPPSALAAVADVADEKDADRDVEDLAHDRALESSDPLMRRPRVSSVVLAVVLGLLLVLAAAGVWWLAVRTVDGQTFDDMAESFLDSRSPAWLGAVMGPLVSKSAVHHVLTVAVSAAMGVAALVIAGVRRRWWLLGQLVAYGALCYAATWLKELLPRPLLVHTTLDIGNSAPSGHTLMAMAAALALLMAVSRSLRAAAAALAALWGSLIGVSVVFGKWHRPADAVTALLLAGALALLVLSVSRTSGMDRPGTRRSSTGVQIVGTVLLVGGLLLALYGAYAIWQTVPGLSDAARWAQPVASDASALLIVAVSLLVAGLTAVLRQLTASPLSRLGLVGAPPAPPRR